MATIRKLKKIAFPTSGGTAVFDSDDFVYSVNGIKPNVADGNVQLGNIGAITGEIKWFAFNTAPDGYLVCNGAEISRETYADLFAKIGTTFGSGDSSTTFTLPNLIDKFAQGSTRAGVYKSAGLPNIEGSFPTFDRAYGIYLGGAFYDLNRWNSAVRTGADDNWGLGVGFKASRSSSIYGKSETVQPPALTLLPCIKY